MINAPDIVDMGNEPDVVIAMFNDISSFAGKNAYAIFIIVVVVLIFLWIINKRLRGKDKY